MGNKKRIILINIALVILAIVFTILVKTIDVQAVGVNETDLGFATFNKAVFEALGENKIWYNITDYLGIIAILMSMTYVVIGGIQLIKRKNIFKVDKEIITLGIFYVAVIILYIFFEKFIVNYRPVLIDGVLEASYPSSHTLLIICLCGSSVIINKKMFNNKAINIMNILSIIIAIITVIGRLLSGVHWATDIIGGILISIALLTIFYSVINIKKRNSGINIPELQIENEIPIDIIKEQNK